MDAKRAGKEEIVAWGTAEVSRVFIYVEDAEEGIVLATEKYNKPASDKIGYGFSAQGGSASLREIKSKGLVEVVVDLTGFKGKIIGDELRLGTKLSKYIKYARDLYA